jgi:hypothetical protein
MVLTMVPECGNEGRADDTVSGCFNVEEEMVPTWRHTQRTQRRVHGGGGHRGREGGAGASGCVAGK